METTETKSATLKPQLPLRLRQLLAYWPEVLLLLVTIAGAWLPAGWTQELKRIQQPNWYIGLGVVYLLVFGLVAWAVMHRPDESYRRKWLWLIVLVLLPNILNIWVRYSFEYAPGKPLFGRDADVGLFYKYGHDFATGQTPTFNGNPMEYPQFALFLFWVGERLAGGVQETFYWVFPAWMLAWQLLAALMLYATGRKMGQARAGWLLTVFLAGSPFLYLFNYTRYDIAPTAMLLVAVYLFLPGNSKEGWRGLKRVSPLSAAGAGLSVATGFLAKWLPVVIAPWFLAAYLQAKRWKEAAIFAGSGLLLTLVTMLPFYLSNPEAFWYPYRYQGSRKMIGESFWFLVQYYLFDPGRSIPEKPWGEPVQVILGNNKLLVAQLGLVLVVFTVSVWRLWAKPKAYELWAGTGLVAVAVFTLANRIFSPQYLILLGWVWAVALILKPVNFRTLLMFAAIFIISSGANFLVFLLGVWPEEWLKYSIIMFISGWGLSSWLLGRCLFNLELKKIDPGKHIGVD